jgi:MFS family permease
MIGHDTPSGSTALVWVSLIVALSVLPPFLIGSLSVSISQDLNLTQGRLGLAAATYFTAAALVSPFCGRIIGVVGARRALRSSVALVAVSLLGLASVTGSWLRLPPLLVIGAIGQALAGVSANEILATELPPSRWGIAFGIKQSAIPAATLLAGLAVPVFAVSVGWRWAFVFSGCLALAMLIAIGRNRVGSAVTVASRRREEPPGRYSPPLSLLLAAVAFACGNLAANAMGIFLVPYAVDLGVSLKNAGLLLGAGGVIGIIGRLSAGVWSDRRSSAGLVPVAVMLTVGSMAMVMIGSGIPWLLLPAAMIAFGFGWGWNGLFLRSIVRSNEDNPSRATGIVQTGGLLGAGLGPLLFGALAAQVGFAWSWVVAAGFALAAALILGLVSLRMSAEDGRAGPTLTESQS